MHMFTQGRIIVRVQVNTAPKKFTDAYAYGPLHMSATVSLAGGQVSFYILTEQRHRLNGRPHHYRENGDEYLVWHLYSKFDNRD